MRHRKQWCLRSIISSDTSVSKLHTSQLDIINCDLLGWASPMTLTWFLRGPQFGKQLRGYYTGFPGDTKDHDGFLLGKLSNNIWYSARASMRLLLEIYDIPYFKSQKPSNPKSLPL